MNIKVSVPKTNIAPATFPLNYVLRNEGLYRAVGRDGMILTLQHDSQPANRISIFLEKDRMEPLCTGDVWESTRFTKADESIEIFVK